MITREAFLVCDGCAARSAPFPFRRRTPPAIATMRDAAGRVGWTTTIRDRVPDDRTWGTMILDLCLKCSGP